MKVAVSILNGDKKSDAVAIEKINKTDAEYLHVDVQDGKYTTATRRDYDSLHLSKKPLDVHLMVANPFNYISKYALLNTEVVVFHLEIDEDINGLLDYIKSMGLKCGLAIKAETSIEKLEPYLGKLDKVLLLTVTLGASNQKMIESSLYKIDVLRQIRREKGYNFEIFVDGGVNDETISKISGADGVVSDSFVRNHENYQDGIDKLRL